jgi:hypothetical protein
MELPESDTPGESCRSHIGVNGGSVGVWQVEEQNKKLQMYGGLG